MNELTQRGIAALKAGDRISARQLLSTALRQNPTDLQAWLWMSGAVERDEERLDCLRHILRLEPGNQAAARGIAQILKNNPQLRTKIEQPLHPIDTTTQKASISLTQAAHINHDKTPHEVKETGDGTLERVNQTTQQPQIQEASPPYKTSDQTTEITASETSPEKGTRVIPIVYPRLQPTYYNPTEWIFRSRPSLVPAILFFWMMVFVLYGSLVVTGQSSDVQYTFPVVLALGVVCGLFTLYVLIRLFNTRYELTNEILSLPQSGKKIELAVWSIVSIETQQSFFQKILGTGDILLDVPLGGMLGRIRIRNIPDARHRAEQILHQVRYQN